MKVFGELKLSSMRLKTWAKKHCDCRIKILCVKTSDGHLTACNCMTHNQIYFYKFNPTANKREGM